MNAAGIKSKLKELPILRAFGHSTPNYHVGSVLENRIGSQVFRTLSKNIAWRMRSGISSAGVERDIETVERDGILVIENFLPLDDFHSVLKEYETVVQSSELRPYKAIDNATLYRTQIQLSTYSERLASIEKHFQKDPSINRIASAIIRRKIVRRPEVFLDRYKRVIQSGVENDIENVLHADLHTPTVKMFFYLNDVNQTNGAFIYVKGSHTLTFQRLLHEYDMSVRQAKLRRGLLPDRDLIETRGREVRNTIPEMRLRKMGLIETQIHASPNTLVIANNMGFHRRGEFIHGAERKAILINYRNAEPVFF